MYSKAEIITQNLEIRIKQKCTVKAEITKFKIMRPETRSKTVMMTRQNTMRKTIFYNGKTETLC